MHIDVEPRDDHAVLHLRGEFDTYYCPALQQEVDALLSQGVNRVVLNMRMVRFINSTALGAIVKASRSLAANGGKLVVSRPSMFYREISEKSGLVRVVPNFEDDEVAAQALAPGESRGGGKGRPASEDSVVRFARVGDRATNDEIGSLQRLGLTELAFTWEPDRAGRKLQEMARFALIGTELRLRFQVPFTKGDELELVGRVTSLTETAEGLGVLCTLSRVSDEAAAALANHVRDMVALREDLREAAG